MQKTEDGKIIITKDDFGKLYLKVKGFLAKPNSWKIISLVVFTFIFILPATMISSSFWDVFKVGFYVLLFWYCGYRSGKERTDDMVKRIEVKIKDHLRYKGVLNSNYADVIKDSIDSFRNSSRY